VTRYAEQTTVPADRSRAEIEKALSRYGASSFMYGWDGNRAVVAFVVNGRQVRFLLPIPDRNDRQFTQTPTRRTPRSTAQAEAAYDQAVRQRWRALNLVIKAKLEAVETGIVSFENEFLAHLVLPNGETVGEWVQPQMDEVYGSGAMPALLPQYGRRAIEA
jgi:hypothetical protein